MEKSEIINAIKTVFDPEIPVDIWEMGMIYEISISQNNDVKIVMTLTAPNCPVADTLPEDVRSAVMQVKDVGSVWVELTFEPPWSTEMMSEIARIELDMM